MQLGTILTPKNYVKNFGVINLSSTQVEEILSLSSKDEINEYVEHLYGVNLKRNECTLAVECQNFPTSIFEFA